MRLKIPIMHLHRNRSFASLSLALIVSMMAASVPVSAQNGIQRPSEWNRSDVTRPIATPLDVPSAKQGVAQPSSSGPLIAPGDEIDVMVYDAPDLSIRSRIGPDGSISLPLIGHVRIAGLTGREAEATIKAKLLRDNIVNDPQVSVDVKEYGSSGISVTGEVVKPGVYSAIGPHRLFDILQEAGGVTERAAASLTVFSQNGQSRVTVELPHGVEGLARLDVELRPGDTVIVPKAGIVYVLGEVRNPGGYLLNGVGGITLLRVVAAAGGPTQAAALGRTNMLRRTPNGLQELSLPLKKVLRAKVADIPLQADDIIYIPSSRMKQVLNTGTLMTAAGTASIYRVVP